MPDQISKTGPNWNPEEDPQERVQSFLDAMPAIDTIVQLPASPAPLAQTAVTQDMQTPFAVQPNTIPSQNVVTIGTVNVPIPPNDNKTVVTLPTLTTIMASRPHVAISVSTTTSSFVTSQSQAVTIVTSQMMHSSSQSLGIWNQLFA